MNIEGAEWEVLEDSEDRLFQVQEMVIEYHHLPRVTTNFASHPGPARSTGIRILNQRFRRCQQSWVAPSVSDSNQQAGIFCWSMRGGSDPSAPINTDVRLRGVSMAPWTRMFSFPSRRTAGVSQRSRRQVNQEGWDSYARSWDVARNQGQIPDLRSDHAADAQHLGDEWSLMEDTEFPYGVDARSVQSFAEYIEQRMLVPFLPPRRDLTILEIGPGGGRITALLLPRARQLYAVDVSAAMLQRLQQRFDGDPRIAPLLTDGTNIAGIPAASLDAAVSFDAFVHFEPWEIFQYLEIVRALLREGGLGIVHFSDIETSIGFELFQSQVPARRAARRRFRNVLGHEQEHHGQISERAGVRDRRHHE